MFPHPDITRAMALERYAELLGAAEQRRRIAGYPRPEPLSPDPAERVTLRLDRVADEPRLRDLAGLCERRFEVGTYVVAEIGGRVLAALSLTGGAPLRDPFERTGHLIPLLELRVAQINRRHEPRLRRGLRPRRGLRLLLRRA